MDARSRIVGPAILAFSMTVFALPALMIDGGPHDDTDEGSIDSYIDETGNLPGDQKEIDWVTGILGTSYV